MKTANANHQLYVKHPLYIWKHSMLEYWKPTLDSFPGGLMLAYVAGNISTDFNFWDRTASRCVSPCPRHFNVGFRANERPLRLIAHRRIRFSHLCLYQHWHWGQGELIESNSKRVAFRLPSTTSWLSSDLASLAVLMLCIVTVVTCGWDPVTRVPSINAGATLLAHVAGNHATSADARCTTEMPAVFLGQVEVDNLDKPTGRPLPIGSIRFLSCTKQFS